MRTMWGGALGSQGSDAAANYGNSLQSDLTLFAEELDCSIAHARMLGATETINGAVAERLVEGLTKIQQEGPQLLPTDAEDIHTAVEARLEQLLGEEAGSLHTARSRNDQIATVTRLWLRRRCDEIEQEIKSAQRSMLQVAQENARTLMPGLSHTQHAQPTTLGHWMLAHLFAFQTDLTRWRSARDACGESPLGCAAGFGNVYKIDPEHVAVELGFERPAQNSLRAVSDRLWVLDALHAAACTMIDLSSVAAELVLWSTPEYGYVRLPDSVTTGSSIMPQKRNPDIAELIRGRASGCLGNWVELAATLKGLPLGYHRDLQDDKPPLFSAVALCMDSLPLVAECISGTQWYADRMAASTQRDFSTAVDLAGALTDSMPFRQAHAKVGQVVRDSQARGIGLEDLTTEELEGLGAKPTANLDPAMSAASRSAGAGPGEISLKAQLAAAKKLLAPREIPLAPPGERG